MAALVTLAQAKWQINVTSDKLSIGENGTQVEASGNVEINELITGVNNALNGCGTAGPL